MKKQHTIAKQGGILRHCTRQKENTQKGITLVALVVTIIVILILAVVAIQAVKNDGIISHAKNAQTMYLNVQFEEQLQISISEAKINYNELNANSKEVIKGNLLRNYKNIIFKDISDSNLEISLNSDKYLIDKNFNIIKKVEGNSNLWECDVRNRRITKYIGEDLETIQEITIPNYIDGIWIQSIRGIHAKESIFGAENSNINKIVISEGITNIESSAFYRCYGLQEVKFPNSLEGIQWGAFAHCANLAGDLTIPENVRSISQCALDQCTSLNGTLMIGSKIQKIGTYAFAGCKFKKVIINANKNNVIIYSGQGFKIGDITWLK